MIGSIANMDYLKRLQEIYLDYNYIENLNGIENLKNLRLLRANHNHIKNIDALVYLTKVIFFYFFLFFFLLEFSNCVNKER